MSEMMYLRSDGILFLYDDHNSAACSIQEKYKSSEHASKAIGRCISRNQKTAGGYKWKIIDIGYNCLREHKTYGYIYF